MVSRIPPPPRKVQTFLDRKWKESIQRLSVDVDDISQLGILVVTPVPSELPNSRRLVGSSDVSVTDGGSGGNALLALTTTGVAPGTYTNATLTVDARGRLTAASSGASPAPNSGSYVTISSEPSLTSERALTGTTNQINITDNGAGNTVVLSLPQSIHTGANVTFSNLTLSSSLTVENSLSTSFARPHFLTGVDISAGGVVELITWGDPNINPTISYNLDLGSVFDFNSAIRSAGIHIPANANAVAYFTALDVGYGQLVTSNNLTFNGTTLSLPNATSASTGLVIGSTARFYQDVAQSGSGNTLVNPRVRENLANFLINAPNQTNITASEAGFQVNKQANWSAASTARSWGLLFSASSNGAFGSSDGTSGLVGVEGNVQFTPTGAATMAAMSGAILFNAINDNATVTRYAGLDAYGADVTGTSIGGIATEATAVVARLGRAAGRGSIVTNYGLQIRNATVSGTGFITNQSGIQGNGMAAITANGQTRRFIEIPAMPAPGVFTGLTNYAIDILGTSRAVRDGIRLAGDVELYSGAANRLDIAAGDSFYIPNDTNGFALGTTPNAIYTSNNRRTTTGALSTSPAVVNCEFLINHGVTGFPSAMRMFVPINGGANNVGYAAGISAQVSVQNGHTAQANNITAADFSARWNTNQATASSNSLLGARIYSTSDNATISGSVSNLFGGSFEAGVNTAATTFTVNTSIIAGEFIIRVPQLGAGTASAFGASFPNHNIGTSAPINTAGHIRLAPLTAAYGSGTRYPILFNGTNTSHNEIGIWWGTDASNVSLGRVGNNILGLGSGDSLQLTAGDIITDTTTGTKIGTATTQKIAFFNSTPITQPGTYTITAAPAVSTALNADANGGAYTGIDNAQAGAVYAQLSSLNDLRGDVESVAAVLRQVIKHFGDTSGLGLINETSY